MKIEHQGEINFIAIQKRSQKAKLRQCYQGENIFTRGKTLNQMGKKLF